MANLGEIGKYLARLRDDAGIKQNELAKMVTWSPAVLSRVESGERAVSIEELNSILEAIGTDDALGFRETAGRDWRELQKPAFGHPDELLLWKAEEALQGIEDLSGKPDIRNVFVRRLKEFRDELKNAANLVSGTEHTVAFVGDIGVGKSTAICRVSDLEVQKDRTQVPVLEVGGGGVTICEVHLVQGPHYGLVVEPMGESELRREVIEFAHFLKRSSDGNREVETEDIDSHGTSKEIERAIRNMSGLTRKVNRDTKPDGKRVRITVDSAKELAEKIADSSALAVEILTRMALQRRTRRELRHSEHAGNEPLQWLKKNFEEVNNGRHPEFSVPKRIEITVPQVILGEESLSIRIVDTKGIDRTAERRDLEEHLSAPNTIVLLCSSFNAAPSTSVQQLLERAKKGRVVNLETKVAVLALPRPGEALAVKDDAGFSAETKDDGYNLKSEQVEIRIGALNVPDISVGFYNALEDAPDRLSVFLLKLIAGLRRRHRGNLKQAIDGANYLVQNYEKTQVDEIQRQAANSLLIWRKNNQEIGEFSRQMEDSLLSAINRAHPSSLRASVRRQGEWYNLDYSHQLGYGSRAMAAYAVGTKLERFKAVAENLLQNPELEVAYSLVRQARHILESGTEDLLQKSQHLGTTIHTVYLKPDGILWDNCDNEWGLGPGYRDRVLSHHKTWFADDSQDVTELADGFIEFVTREWQDVLKRLGDILEEN